MDFRVAVRHDGDRSEEDRRQAIMIGNLEISKSAAGDNEVTLEGEELKDGLALIIEECNVFVKDVAFKHGKIYVDLGSTIIASRISMPLDVRVLYNSKNEYELRAMAGLLHAHVLDVLAQMQEVQDDFEYLDLEYDWSV
jgi:hypothetical protein